LHCMIAWGVGAGGLPFSATEHEAMEAVLADEDWLRVFPGVVVVTLADEAQRVALQQRLVSASKDKLNSRALFVMSPLIGPGSGIYRGYLPTPIWEPLNKKTV